MDTQELIARLRLVPHFEGGFYRETYRSDEALAASSLPERYGAERALSTAIYYVLTPGTFSAMHRLASDEIFHFYLGDPVEMLQLHADGSHSLILIGSDIEAGQSPQAIVVRGTWQGCRLVSGGSYALMGTTVAPAFDPADYEHGNRAELIARYPQCEELITQLTGG